MLNLSVFDSHTSKWPNGSLFLPRVDQKKLRKIFFKNVEKTLYQLLQFVVTTNMVGIEKYLWHCRFPGSSFQLLSDFFRVYVQSHINIR